MSVRNQIIEIAPAGTDLIQASNRGQKVWALSCAQHARGLHKHTLSSGIACYAWAGTQADLLKQLTA